MALLAATIVTVATVGTAHAATGAGLSFDGDFQSGITAWTSTGGGAQCANHGTPSTAPRIRGNVYTGSTAAVAGVQAGRFDLPASQANYPLQACEMLHSRPLGLGTDDYYGYMFYVPPGWTNGTNGFWGIATAQIHFQNIWGAPITFELHNDHMTLALETGACINYTSPNSGCQWRSNADNPGGNPGNLGAQYVVPPGMQQGVWHQVVMHVHWASDNTGQIQVWHRVTGDPSWTQTVNLSGFPTVQWDSTVGCCSANAMDKIGAYRGPASQPVSVWERGLVIGSSFNAAAGAIDQPSTSPIAAAPPASTQTRPATTKLHRHPARATPASERRSARARRACRIQRAAARRQHHKAGRRHRARQHHRRHVVSCGGNLR